MSILKRMFHILVDGYVLGELGMSPPSRFNRDGSIKPIKIGPAEKQIMRTIYKSK